MKKSGLILVCEQDNGNFYVLNKEHISLKVNYPECIFFDIDLCEFNRILECYEKEPVNELTLKNMNLYLNDEMIREELSCKKSQDIGSYDGFGYNKEYVETLLKEYEFVYCNGEFTTTKDMKDWAFNEEKYCYEYYSSGCNLKQMWLDEDYENIELIATCDYYFDEEYDEWRKERTGEYVLYQKEDGNYFVMYNSFYQGSLINSEALFEEYEKNQIESIKEKYDFKI